MSEINEINSSFEQSMITPEWFDKETYLKEEKKSDTLDTFNNQEFWTWIKSIFDTQLA